MTRMQRRTSSPRHLPDWAKGSLACACAFLAGIALTSISADAQPSRDAPPQEHVQHARDSAQRAVAANLALSKLSSPTEPAQDDSPGDEVAPPLPGDTPTISALKAPAAPQAQPSLLAAAKMVQPVKLTRVPTDWLAAGLDLSKAEEVDGKLVQVLPGGARVTLTIDPTTQRYLEKLYAQYKIPYGGVALIEPSTGRVRALVSQTHGEQAIEDVATKPIAPSASVFKIITAAALMEGERISEQREVCYHGGRSSLTKKNIEGDARLDTRCGNLSDAVTWSINSLIAKLAYENLSRSELEDWAHRFGYNQDIPFELPLERSVADIPADDHERARTAAGFWNTHLSPLHGALISAAVLNDGVMMRPTLIQTFESAQGKTLYEFSPRVLRRVVKKATAHKLVEMMSRTTHVGTARKYFRLRNEFPGDIATGGKTGTLSRKQPSYLGYTWFVGFGEGKEKGGPEIAVGGLVCNKPLWHIKGPYAASEAIRVYIEQERKRIKAI